MDQFISDRFACVIPDPDMKAVIVTGGGYTKRTVSVYTEAGWQGDLKQLTSPGRLNHACSSFIQAGEKVVILIQIFKYYFDIFFSTSS